MYYYEKCGTLKRSCYKFEWRPVWNCEICKMNIIQKSFIWTKYLERILLSHSELKWRRLMVHFNWFGKNLNSRVRNSILNLQKLVNHTSVSSDIMLEECLSTERKMVQNLLQKLVSGKIAYLWSVYLLSSWDLLM